MVLVRGELVGWFLLRSMVSGIVLERGRKKCDGFRTGRGV